jgi:hypothetical protein
MIMIIIIIFINNIIVIITTITNVCSTFLSPWGPTQAINERGDVHPPVGFLEVQIPERTRYCQP